MDLENLPPQLRPLIGALASALRVREPAIRQRIEALRVRHPQAGPDELSRHLIRATRRRVAATGAATGAAAIAPGLGTLVAVGTVASQSLYALEQEVELVLAIAILHGHELESSDQRLLEALVVVGLAGGAVKLRENVLVAGGQRITVGAFRRMPEAFLRQGGTHVLTRVLGRIAGTRAAAGVARVAPLAVGMAVGAAFDWVSVSALGRAAISYYGPGGPAQRAALPPPGVDLDAGSAGAQDLA